MGGGAKWPAVEMLDVRVPTWALTLISVLELKKQLRAARRRAGKGAVNSQKAAAAPPGTPLSFPTAFPVRVRGSEPPPPLQLRVCRGRSQGTSIQMRSERTRQTGRQPSLGAGSPPQTLRPCAVHPLLPLRLRRSPR